MKPIARIPIDWPAIAAESGCTSGTLVYHPALGWGVQNGNGPADFCCITAPEVEPGQELRINQGAWEVVEDLQTREFPK